MRDLTQQLQAAQRGRADAEERFLKATRPQFVAEITGVFVEGDHKQPDWIRIYVELVVRNQGADSAIDRWMWSWS